MAAHYRERVRIESDGEQHAGQHVDQMAGREVAGIGPTRDETRSPSACRTLYRNLRAIPTVRGGLRRLQHSTPTRKQLRRAQAFTGTRRNQHFRRAPFGETIKMP